MTGKVCDCGRALVLVRSDMPRWPWGRLEMVWVCPAGHMSLSRSRRILWPRVEETTRSPATDADMARLPASARSTP